MAKDQTGSCRRKDFQWMSGIATFIAFSIAFTLLTFVYLTTKPVAVEIGTVAVASSFSSNGLDDETEIERLRHQIKDNEVFQPIPGIPATVTGRDIREKSPRELRLAIFRQIVEPIYEGESGVSEFSGQKLSRGESLSRYGALAFLSRSTNTLLRMPFVISAVVALFALVALIYFSRGRVRLVSPALTIGLANLPGLLFFSLLWIVSHSSPPPSDTGPLSGRVGQALRDTLPVVAESLARIYIIIGAVAILALIIALIGKIAARRSAS